MLHIEILPQQSGYDFGNYGIIVHQENRVIPAHVSLNHRLPASHSKAALTPATGRFFFSPVTG
jgi:hypothetical protein